MRTLTIGELATEGGVGIETVRYYERRGLLREPARTAAGYRQYDEAALQRLVWIRRAKDLGFTLAEIAELLDGGARSPQEIARAAGAKAVDVAAEIARLHEVRRRLESLVGLCVSGDGTACVRLDAAGVPVTRSLQDASELLA
ncbi:MAG: MerR family transcriptional regulator [Microthrixaceae bacterium]